MLLMLLVLFLTDVAQVALLQRPLTDDVDHDGRAKAVQLLSQVSSYPGHDQLLQHGEREGAFVTVLGQHTIDDDDDDDVLK
jgi:hypothetical protein